MILWFGACTVNLGLTLAFDMSGLLIQIKTKLGFQGNLAKTNPFN